jgi:hypothetical protein
MTCLTLKYLTGQEFCSFDENKTFSGWVTRRVWEKIPQNVAQPVFVKIFLWIFPLKNNK